jgi:hypothetical protein
MWHNQNYWDDLTRVGLTLRVALHMAKAKGLALPCSLFTVFHIEAYNKSGLEEGFSLWFQMERECLQATLDGHDCLHLGVHINQHLLPNAAEGLR